MPILYYFRGSKYKTENLQYFVHIYHYHSYLYCVYI